MHWTIVGIVIVGITIQAAWAQTGLTDSDYLGDACSNCLYMDAIGSTSRCEMAYTRGETAWNSATPGRASSYYFVAENVCLGLAYKSSGAGDGSGICTGYNDLTTFIGSREIPNSQYVNLWSGRTIVQIRFKIGSAWACVQSPDGPESLRPPNAISTSTRIGRLSTWSMAATGATSWLYTPWGQSGQQRDSTVVFIYNDQGLRINVRRCTASWPDCIPDGWPEYMQSGIFLCPDDTSAGCPAFLLQSSPFLSRRVWCTTIGRHSTDRKLADACGPTSCNDPIGGTCRSNGYCQCNEGYGQADCTVPIPPSLLSDAKTKFPPIQFTQTGGYPGQTPPNWRSWTCEVFNPCSGSGRCVNPPPGAAYDSYGPQCLCFPGFFGNSSADIRAYATALDCGNQVPVPIVMTWSNRPGSGENSGPMTRYLMFHQCQLWNGDDNPTNWKVAESPLTKYHPTAPRVCAEGGGEGCTPCPPCIKNQGECATDVSSRVNYCKCKADWAGHLCQTRKCPVFQVRSARTQEGTGAAIFVDSSPCGEREEVPRGRCVESDTSPTGFACQCDNGYGGIACQNVTCPIGLDNRICSGSGLSMFAIPDYLPARGICNDTQCLCFDAFAGTACEELSCPKAPQNGLVCNGLLSAQAGMRSVCMNGRCECGLNRTFANRWEGWWGAACEFSYNDACRDPLGPPTIPSVCNGAVIGGTLLTPTCQVPTNTREPNARPVCNCDGTGRTGPYCRYSLCGSYNNEHNQPVSANAVCDGFRFAAEDNFQSGECTEVMMPPIPVPTSPGQRTYPGQPVPSVSAAARGSNYVLQPFGKCQCKVASRALMVKYGIDRRSTFLGDFCQLPVPGCTNPIPPQAGVDEYSLPCSSNDKELRGVCIQVENPSEMPGVPKDNPYRCACVEGFEGDYCQNEVAVCRPICRPGAGDCKATAGTGSRFREENKCICFAPSLWSSEEGRGPYPGIPDARGRPYGPYGCDMDWCNMTMGITSLYYGACFCPTGRQWTEIAISPDLAKAIRPLPKYPEDVRAISGCRRACPIAPPVAGIETVGIECGVEPLESHVDSTKGTGFSVCSTATTVHQIGDFDRAPVCLCSSPVKGVDPYSIRPGIPASQQAGFGGDTEMMYVLNPTLGYCEPVCGHGSQWERSFNATSGRAICTCPEMFTLRYAECCKYRPPDYKTEWCKNGGTPSCGKGVGGSTACTCPPHYRLPYCEESDCFPGILIPGLEICNCTSPWQADTRFGSPTFGKCISMCRNGGIANPETRRCNCRPGWEGAICEVNQCAPFGVITGDGTPGNPVCTCTTTVLTGAFCKTPNCGATGKIDYGTSGLQPTCVCEKLWTGTLCDKSLCSITGDDGLPTGEYQVASIPNGDGTSRIETFCKCRPGYGQDAIGACTRPKCGARGVVVVTGPNPTDYSCRCDGPDTLNQATGECVSGTCVYGSLQTGVGDQRATCVCPAGSGYTGPTCSQFACPNADKFQFIDGLCKCIPPWTGPNCDDNVCGPGVFQIQPTNLPGNPRTYECICDALRGYVAKTGEIKSPYDCVLDCIGENTAAQSWDSCTCKSSWKGTLCDTPALECPPLPEPSESGQAGGMISKQTFVGTIVGLVIGIAIVGLAAGLGVYFYMLNKTKKEPIATVLTTPAASAARFGVGHPFLDKRA